MSRPEIATCALKTNLMAEEISAWKCQVTDFRCKTLVYLFLLFLLFLIIWGFPLGPIPASIGLYWLSGSCGHVMHELAEDSPPRSELHLHLFLHLGLLRPQGRTQAGRREIQGTEIFNKIACQTGALDSQLIVPRRQLIFPASQGNHFG